MSQIYCLGKNYPGHAAELKEAQPEFPVVFLKPKGAALQAPRWGECLDVPFPSANGRAQVLGETGEVDLHHECEVVLRWSGQSVDAVTVGLDMTLRSHQSWLKKQGYPWTTAKVFEGSAILAPWVTVTDDSWEQVRFAFEVEGKPRQEARAEQMLFKANRAVQYLKNLVPLQAGDWIFTGTPAGVAAVLPGQRGRLFWGDQWVEIHWRKLE